MSGLGLGRSFVKTALRFPRISRLSLRAMIRSRIPIPGRCKWIVDALIEKLPFPNEFKQVSIGNGLKLELSMNSAIGRLIYYYGTFEPDVAWYIREELRPGDVLIDAGANVGELTILAAKKVGATGQVLALEPSLQVTNRLRRNVDLNQLRNVNVVESAIGGNDSLRQLFVGDGIDSLDTSMTPLQSTTARSLTVQCRSLDSIIKEFELANISIVKLDIEGAEFEALRDGASRMLNDLQFRPRIIFEYNHHVAERAGWTLYEICQFLSEAKYRLSRLEDRRLVDLDPNAMAANSMLPNKFDVVAVPV